MDISCRDGGRGEGEKRWVEMREAGGISKSSNVVYGVCPGCRVTQTLYSVLPLESGHLSTYWDEEHAKEGHGRMAIADGGDASGHIYKPGLLFL